MDARGVERELVPGAGAVVQEGAHKVALFRDPGGRLHRLNAICPHLGCLLAWNPADKTVDCPCHGSCFDCLGRCIQGPALTDLEDLGDVLGPPAAEPAVAPQERRPQEPSGPA